MSPDERERDSVIRHEEEATGVEKRWRGAGFLRARKRVERVRVSDRVPTKREEVRLERQPAHADDSGKVETLPDGTISIPVYEEELVVTRRTVLKERVLIRKATVSEQQTVRDELRRERVEITSDRGLEDRVMFEGAPERPPPDAGAGDAPDTLVLRASQPRSRGLLGDVAEARPSFVTSEFVFTAIAVVVVAVATAFDQIDVSLAFLLLTAIVGAYAISRGFAKSRTPHGR